MNLSERPCENPLCPTPAEPVTGHGLKRYHDDACKQQAYRYRNASNRDHPYRWTPQYGQMARAWPNRGVGAHPFRAKDARVDRFGEIGLGTNNGAPPDKRKSARAHAHKHGVFTGRYDRKGKLVAEHDIEISSPFPIPGEDMK